MRTREQIVDEMLVLAAQARHVEAFGRLAERWHRRLLRHALRTTGDPEGAREAVQEAWVAIARGLRKLHDPACFGAWALRITTRRCTDWIARQKRERGRRADLGAALQAPAPPEGRADRLASARELLRRLDSDQRSLMAMFYLEGLSVAEISRVLDIPAGTVKSRLFHARGKLRAALEVTDDTNDRSRRVDSGSGASGGCGGVRAAR